MERKRGSEKEDYIIQDPIFRPNQLRKANQEILEHKLINFRPCQSRKIKNSTITKRAKVGVATSRQDQGKKEIF